MPLLSEEEYKKNNQNFSENYTFSISISPLQWPSLLHLLLSTILNVQSAHKTIYRDFDTTVRPNRHDSIFMILINDPE